jgi:transposase-like protein
MPCDRNARIVAMDRELLERYLDEGKSLAQIGELVGRDPSTVGYWVQKHGLVANGRDKHVSRGGLAREQLEPLIEAGATQEEIAQALGVSVSTVRHWLKKFDLRTLNGRGPRPRVGGMKPLTIVDDCTRHGPTEFILEGRGAYRCKRCRSEAVARWRRNKKKVLIEEAGGACRLCGYSGHPAALHFHHVDPATKRFSLSRFGITRSLAESRAEAAKCVLLCANCHAEVEVGAAELPIK